jgi:hypothetical protein
MDQSVESTVWLFLWMRGARDAISYQEAGASFFSSLLIVAGSGERASRAGRAQ